MTRGPQSRRRVSAPTLALLVALALLGVFFYQGHLSLMFASGAIFSTYLAAAPDEPTARIWTGTMAAAQALLALHFLDTAVPVTGAAGGLLVFLALGLSFAASARRRRASTT